MSVRTKVLGLVDVIMRVPPLLVIDEILKISMGLPGGTSSSSSPISPSVALGFFAGPSRQTSVDYSINSNLTDLSQNDSDDVNEDALSNLTSDISKTLTKNTFEALAYDPDFYFYISLTTAKFLICLFGILTAACIFVLWTRHLVIVYMFITSVGLIFLSYWSNVSALSLMENNPCILEDILSVNMNRLLDPGGLAFAILPHFLAQWFMGLLFAYLHLGPRHQCIQKLLPFCFLMPLLLGILPLPRAMLKDTPAFAAVIPFVLTKISLWSSSVDVGLTVYNGYQYAKTFATNFGLSALVETEWQRLNVPCVLRAFWTIRLSHQLVSMAINSDAPLSFLITMQKLLVSGCETLTAVLGMTSIISIICNYIGKCFQYFLLSEDLDEDRSLGTISAILFYILALQTGLTSLSPEKRFIRLCRNLCLLVTALLHFLHNIVSPILMSLSAARNPSRKRHARALIVCAFLLIAPMCLLTVLWSRHPPSTWLLAVTAFSIEAIVKVLVSLATYTLFLLDARRQTFWEKLDDYVYYIRAFGNSVEFCFGIFLFFNGAWILIFESARNVAGGAIRALMMCIHAYFNIWCEARAGWTVFMKRRTAVHKISSLPEATPSQLRMFDDVCAICYQEMASAKITRCKHFFHGVCLRKWLYVQDRCPLCHEIMMYQEKPKTDEENIENDAENVPGPAPAEGEPVQQVEEPVAPVVGFDTPIVLPQTENSSTIERRESTTNNSGLMGIPSTSSAIASNQNSINKPVLSDGQLPSSTFSWSQAQLQQSEQQQPQQQQHISEFDNEVE